MSEVLNGSRHPAHRVTVEVIHLHPDPDGGTLRWRLSSRTITKGEDPDQAALGQMNLPAGGSGVCHSTSWRWEPTDHVILTYATVSPTPDHDRTEALLSTGVVTSGDPLRPRPPLLHEHHVVAHAIQHLADLARRDPGIRNAASHPEVRHVWDAISRTAGTLGTSVHERAHTGVPR